MGLLMALWRFQFRLRYLLAATFFLCIAFTFLAVCRQQVAVHCAAVEHLRFRGFHLQETDSSSAAKGEFKQEKVSWLFTWGRRFYFAEVPSVASITLNGRERAVTKEDLNRLLDVQTLQVAALNVVPECDDDYVAKLCKKRALQKMFLMNTSITDLACEDLCQLPELAYLNLNGTEITNKGLGQLATAPKLNMLFLRRTNATQAGVEKFQKAKPNCTIVFVPRESAS